MEISGVRQLDAFWKSVLENGANRPNPFEASTYDGVPKAAVGHLDPSGVYEVLTDDTTPPQPAKSSRSPIVGCSMRASALVGHF
jgi:hypothetical protein